MNVDIVYCTAWESDDDKINPSVAFLTSVERKWQSVQCYQKATEKKYYLTTNIFILLKKKNN